MIVADEAAVKAVFRNAFQRGAIARGLAGAIRRAEDTQVVDRSAHRHRATPVPDAAPLVTKHLLRRFPNTSAAVMLVLVTFVIAAFWDLDVFDLPGVNIIGIEKSEFGQIMIAVLLMVPAFITDRVVTRQRAHEARILAEQRKVFEMTMRTVQDIVNHNLNELQLLRMDADGRVPDETLRHFDATIQNTAARLTALGNLKVFTAKPMAGGRGLHGDPQ